MHDALIREATLTPKAGLVDAVHNGGHHDMNLALFLRSADAIAPYLGDCAATGMTFAGHPASPALLAAIRPIGLAAEAAMRAATGGVNTHKGAIFAFGLIAAALGKRLAEQHAATLADVQADVRALCAEILAELRQGDCDSAGKRGYARHGISGARGEAASGFATVSAHALPLYQQELAADGNERRALLAALVALTPPTTTAPPWRASVWTACARTSTGRVPCLQTAPPLPMKRASATPSRLTPATALPSA